MLWPKPDLPVWAELREADLLCLVQQVREGGAYFVPSLLKRALV